MDIDFVENKEIKSLLKNPIFLISVIVILILAFYNILKNNPSNEIVLTNTTSYSDYPTAEENTTTIIDSINSDASINKNDILTAIQDTNSFFDIEYSELKNIINENSETTNDFLKEGFQNVQTNINFSKENILEQVQNSENYLSSSIEKNQSNFMDKIEEYQNKNNKNYETIYQNIQSGFQNNKDSLTNLKNHTSSWNNAVQNTVNHRFDLLEKQFKNLEV